MILLAPVLAAALAAAQATAAPAAPSPAGTVPSKKTLTLEMVSETRMPVPYAWRDATHVVWPDSTGEPEAPAALWQADAATGRKAKLLDASTVKDRDGKEKTLPFRGAVWTPKGDTFAVPFDHDLWLVAPGGVPRRLTNDPEDESVPAWSPDGTRLAYVKKHDLFMLEVATGKETRLTTSGSDGVLNGVLDWVYGEELAARRSNRSFIWAPDSAAIAYLSLDQTRVPTYPIVDYVPTNGRVEAERYPKAGDANAIPSVHVVDLAGKETASFAPSPDDVYVAPEMSWTRGRKGGLLPPPRPAADAPGLAPPRTSGRHAENARLRERSGVDQRARAAPFPERRLVRPPLREKRLSPPLSLRGGRHAEERDHEGRLDGRRPVERRRGDGNRLVPRDDGGPARTPGLHREAGRLVDDAGHGRARRPRARFRAGRRALRRHVLERRDAPAGRRPLRIGRRRRRPRRKAAPARRRRHRERRARDLHGLGRDPLLHAAREAVEFRSREEIPGHRRRLRRAARPARPERVGPALRRLPRLEGLPRLVDGRARLVGTRARVRDAAPEEHGRAGARRTSSRASRS